MKSFVGAVPEKDRTARQLLLISGWMGCCNAKKLRTWHRHQGFSCKRLSPSKPRNDGGRVGGRPGPGARLAGRECFDARDPIPQRGRKPLRKPPTPPGVGGGAIFYTAADAMAEFGSLEVWEEHGKATRPRARFAGSTQPRGVRKGQEEAKAAACCKMQHQRSDGESRMGYQPVMCRGAGVQGVRGGRRRQGSPGSGKLSSR